MFVGNTAVSTETKSAKGTHEYEIKADYQAANTEYIIKVTNANNDQIQKILIWKKGTTKPTETPTAHFMQGKSRHTSSSALPLCRRQKK